MTTTFYIYKKATGQISRIVGSSYDDIGLNVLPDESYGEGFADMTAQYVDGGKIVDMPPKPDGYWMFNYETKSWVPDYYSAALDVDKQVKQLLVDSDWTQLSDVPVTDKTAWQQYRQELRDVSKQPDYPLNVKWPTPPVGKQKTRPWALKGVNK